MLAIFAAGVWPVVRSGAPTETRRQPAPSAVGSRSTIPAFTIPMQVVDFLPGQYDFDTTLPLQLCDFAWIAAVVALWTHSRFAAAVTYFWGLVLTSQALITPWLNADVPSPKFLGYWGMHWLIVWGRDLPGVGSAAHAPVAGLRRGRGDAAGGRLSCTSSTCSPTPTTASSWRSPAAARSWTCSVPGRSTSWPRSPSSRVCGR